MPLNINIKDPSVQVRQGAMQLKYQKASDIQPNGWCSIIACTLLRIAMHWRRTEEHSIDKHVQS